MDEIEFTREELDELLLLETGETRGDRRRRREARRAKWRARLRRVLLLGR